MVFTEKQSFPRYRSRTLRRKESGPRSARVLRLYPGRGLGLLPLLLGILLCVSATTGCFDRHITVWDKDEAYNGITLFNVMTTYSPFGIMNAIDMDGTLLWEFINPVMGPVWEVEVMPGGNLLAIGGYKIFEIAYPDYSRELLWEHGKYGEVEAHHDVDVLSDGSIIFLYYDLVYLDDWEWTISDGIRIVNRKTGEIVWDWRLIDHLPTDHYCTRCIQDYWMVYGTLGKDWSHSNSVTFDAAASAVYLNLRNLNRILKIDYPSGEILWILGDNGDFGEGLLHHAHDPQFLPNGNILLFDNGLHASVPTFGSRVIEIAVDGEARTAEIVWQYSEYPAIMDYIMGDADRLPNGNTLITYGPHGRLVEVTPDGRKVWELQLSSGIKNRIYKAERL